MYIVKTSIRPSKIHGMGCFLEENVKKGQKLWIFNPRFDLLFSIDEVEKLDEPMKIMFKNYAYLDTMQFKGWYCFPTGNDRFSNHSNEPTVVEIKIGECQYIMVASKDLKIGDELTCDYSKYESRKF